MFPETFLFDLDGTLVDSVADLATGVNLLREELDLPPLEEEAVRNSVGDGARLLVRRSLPDGCFSEERVRRFLRLYGEHLLEHTLPYPGIPEFLERHRRKRLAVVTNKPLGLALDLLEGLELRPFFPVVIGGDSCDAKKPHPEPVLAALKRIGGAPGSALMVGDHHTDLAAGRGAGIKTCFCAWGIGRDGGVPHDFRAETPQDLLRLFPGDRP